MLHSRLDEYHWYDHFTFDMIDYSLLLPKVLDYLVLFLQKEGLTRRKTAQCRRKGLGQDVP